MNNIKSKKIIIIAAVCIALSMLCGCSGKVHIDSTELVENIKKVGSFSELISLSGDKLSSYFGFSDTDVHRFNVSISKSGTSADTIAAFEVKNSDQKDTVIQGLSQYLAKLSASFKNTMKSEFNKTETCLIMENENMVVLVICFDSDSVKELLVSKGLVSIY